jgi:acylphosphatase
VAIAAPDDTQHAESVLAVGARTNPWHAADSIKTPVYNFEFEIHIEADLRMAIVARRFLIGGRVQGVGFRMFAADRAAGEGVTGYARNLPDGRVEALVEGEQASVDRVELALRRGPSHAEVESFEVEVVEPTRRHHGFSTH